MGQRGGAKWFPDSWEPPESSGPEKSPTRPLIAKLRKFGQMFFLVFSKLKVSYGPEGRGKVISRLLGPPRVQRPWKKSNQTFNREITKIPTNVFFCIFEIKGLVWARGAGQSDFHTPGTPPSPASRHTAQNWHEAKTWFFVRPPPYEKIRPKWPKFFLVFWSGRGRRGALRWLPSSGALI